MCDIVDFAKYPNLSLLLWDRAVKILEAYDAFSVLDGRLEKYLTADCLNADENAVIESLANEFGGGICGPVTLGGTDRGLLSSEIIEIIKYHIDNNFVRDNGFFLGGTALSSMRYGTVRKFSDIEFVCSEWTALSAVKLRAEELTDLPQIRKIRVDKHDVSLWVRSFDRPVKIVFVMENFLGLYPPADQSGIPSLSDIDLMAIKLMRCADSHFFNCDRARELVDVLTIFIGDPSFLRPAWTKAFSACGTFLHERVLDILSADNLSVLFKDCGISEEKADAFLKAIPSFREELSSQKD